MPTQKQMDELKAKVKRDKRPLNIRLNEAERDAIDQAAFDAGKKPSTWARDTLLKEIELLKEMLN